MQEPSRAYGRSHEHSSVIRLVPVVCSRSGLTMVQIFVYVGETLSHGDVQSEVKNELTFFLNGQKKVLRDAQPEMTVLQYVRTLGMRCFRSSHLFQSL